MKVRHTVLTALSRWRKDIGHQAGVKNGTENHANAADTGVWRPLIDEIILVGGSSRVLSVRDALRNAVAGEPEGSEFVAQSQAPLSKASGTMINSQFDREFCASVDPNQAVSQGNNKINIYFDHFILLIDLIFEQDLQFVGLF